MFFRIISIFAVLIIPVTLSGEPLGAGTISDKQPPLPGDMLDIVRDSLPGTNKVNDEPVHLPVNLLDAVHLDTLPGATNTRKLEISDLAWSADDQRLYAVGDEGYLLTLSMTLTPHSMNDVTWLSLTPLMDTDGKKLEKKLSDSEGLAIMGGADGIKGNHELQISFEQQLRICRYTPNGKQSECERLPDSMTIKKINRRPNEALETVFRHPRAGWVTAPEHAPNDPAHHHLYTKTGERVRLLKYEEGTGIVCADHLPNGHILVLERRYKNWLRLSFVNNLVIYNDPFNKPRYGKGDRKEALKATHVMPLNGDKRYELNYEGCTVIGDDRLLLANDNNALLKSSWLIYLKLSLPDKT